jgi:hypothetical protein
LDFELVYWKDGKEKFDHANTGWPLVGAHTRSGCQNCHTASLIVAEDMLSQKDLAPDRTYLGLGTQCLDCHVDEHQGQMADNCTKCHSQESWKPATGFSHDSTAYPLIEKHAEVSCEKCHSVAESFTPESGKIAKKVNPGVYTRYTKLEFQNCVPCHRDVHENKLGTDCAKCHTTAGFKQASNQKFDHQQTGYPLLGKHIAVDCAKCHTSGTMTAPVAHAVCSDCHKDSHHGQFSDRADGGKCENCHKVDSFMPALYSVSDHAQSRYPLTGSHLAVPCFACHTPIMQGNNKPYARFDFSDVSCASCHADVHRGQLDKYTKESGCEYCHNTSTWHEVSFDHGKTHFPLIGRHETTACMGCHTVENPGTELEMIRMSPLTQECAMCHPDPHRGQFLREGDEIVLCKRCHSPQSWKTLSFDHNRDAAWALDGAHAKVDCGMCHKTEFTADSVRFSRYKPLSFACADCHASNNNTKK